MTATFIDFSLQLVHFAQIEYGDLEDRYSVHVLYGYRSDNIVLAIPHSVTLIIAQTLPFNSALLFLLLLLLFLKRTKTSLFSLCVKPLSKVIITPCLKSFFSLGTNWTL